MAESILFLTGHLARPRLEAVLEGMKPDFDWKVLDIGVKVAALMTEVIIMRRLEKPVEAGKIMLPGRCRADLDRLSAHYGVPVVRGPEEVKDIPVYFGRARKASDMTKYDIQIFAEIIDATTMTIEEILERAEDYSHKGADVIDLGCLPDTPFRISRRRSARSRSTATSRASILRTPTNCCAEARQAPTICSASTRRRCTSPIKWPRRRC
jgi:hypothetical protein